MYNEWYEFLVKNLAKKINGIIYLQTTPEMCLKRTKKRARHGEEGIAIEYLNQLHNLHENWLNREEQQKEINILKLNPDEEFEENLENQQKIMSSTKMFIEQLSKKML